MMQRWGRLWLLLGLLALLTLGVWWWTKPTQKISSPPRPTANDVIPPGIVISEVASYSTPMTNTSLTAVGDDALKDYGNPNLTAKNDLLLLQRSMTDFLTIHKSMSQRPLSANEEWSAALRGTASQSEPWLSAKSPVFDRSLRIVDRWQEPLHFHALGRGQWEIRSAGPDRLMWTQDDLTRADSRK